MKIQAAAMAVILAFSAIPGFAAGDPSAGQQKSVTCAACHGADGNSINPVWPRLAGQHAEYTKKQLLDFQAATRENAQMSPMASPLSAQDIDDLSAYYSAQKAKGGSAHPEHVDLGQKLYRAGNPKSGLPACMACHGPRGSGNPAAAYPALGGQYAEYTSAQLQAFKSEQRANDSNAVMRDIAGKMNNAEIEAVSSYIQGLH